MTGRGYEVHFFNTLDRMAAELETKRASVIVLSDEGDETEIENILVAMMTMPEIQSARLILATTRSSPKIRQLAACSNFRDIIPLDLDEKAFLNRFVYATAGRALNYVQPAGQIALKNISGVNFPARINWIKQNRIRLECKLKVPAGASIVINGRLAQALGVPSLTAKVLQTQRDHLIYRFSEAITAEWQVPSSLRERVQTALESLKAQSIGPRIRVFVAVQSTDIRNAILMQFEDPRFELAMALQRQSIIEDPKYFTPDVVFIEDSLASEEDGARFRQMLTNINAEATVFVIGILPGLEEIQKEFVQHKLVALPRQGSVLSANVLARHLPVYSRNESDRSAVYFASEDPFSIAEVHVPARLTRIHPMAIQLALPYPSSNFGLVRVESPLLQKTIGRSPYVKITATYPDGHPQAAPFGHIIEGYLADCSVEERGAIGNQLSRLIEDSFANIELSQNFVDMAASRSIQRMPEFGSVKASTTDSQAKIVPMPLPILGETDGNTARSLVEFAPGSRTSNLPRAESYSAPVEHVDPVQPVIFYEPTVATSLEKPATEVAVDPGFTIPAPEDPAVVAREARRAARAARKREQTLKNFKTAGTFVAVMIGAIIVLWLFATYVAPNWDRSGSVYSEQLRRFAPAEQPAP